MFLFLKTIKRLFSRSFPRKKNTDIFYSGIPQEVPWIKGKNKFFCISLNSWHCPTERNIFKMGNI